ncbi:MAG: BACON domain-containing protein [Deltaproteobacteria bacterium]|nr:BACON domain-containing protein [Deltaproteobacteria bacterium]
MIHKLLRLFCSIVALGLLFAPNAWTAPAVDYYISRPLAPQLSSDGNSLYYSDPPVVYVLDPNPSAEQVSIPARFDLLSLPESATAAFSITYVASGGTDPWGARCTTFPEEAKAAFNAATAIWGNILRSSVPITISTCWSNLGSSSTLGYSGSPTFSDFAGAPKANTWYKPSLANALAGSCLDSTQMDIYITYNSNFSWYYGTDGNTPWTQVDLMSVVLHEIAHGLNFSGSMAYSGGMGNWGYGDSPAYPDIYDTFMRDGSSRQLIDTGVYANSSTTLGSALTSDNIWFHGGNAMAANGGQRVKMYAPSTWASGSSYSHMDYNTFHNTANALMVYAIPKGTARHDPGPIVEGILKDVGWSATTINPNPPWPLLCSYSNSSASNSFTSSGGTGSVDVTATSGCSWTASSNASWITISEGSSGSGNGTVYYSVPTYTDGSPRTGTMTIAGETFTVNQSGPDLIGNFIFEYQIGSDIFTDRITFKTKSNWKTFDGNDMYIGYDADYPSVITAVGAWYPSFSLFRIFTLPRNWFFPHTVYDFSINADNTLSGCHTQSNDLGRTWSNCHSLIIPSSHKSPLGSWDMSMESKNDPIAMFDKKLAEDQTAQVQRTESSSSVDDDLVSIINEQKAMIENHR